MASLATRLLDIERKIDPTALPRQRPKEVLKALQLVKAMLDRSTSAQWLLSSDDTGAQLVCVPKCGAIIVSKGKALVTIKTYNNAWPVTVSLGVPVEARGRTGIGGATKSPQVVEIVNHTEKWEDVYLVARNAQELGQVLGDFLDSPAMLDWLKVQRL